MLLYYKVDSIMDLVVVVPALVSGSVFLLFCLSGFFIFSKSK